ncbi:hypothetical protein MPLDJ20_130087 [Mesorhizobium plurifarium]|uniref:Uncharacterized protein n=1 Tax=Mesorhizobium plurifarium TaxID=69974 RepID=A0A090EP91_MESPL|nr:hypothetical protein MPLDJ20_130087 [Mesorhizobium plurifarium]
MAGLAASPVPARSIRYAPMLGTMRLRGAGRGAFLQPCCFRQVTPNKSRGFDTCESFRRAAELLVDI